MTLSYPSSPAIARISASVGFSSERSKKAEDRVRELLFRDDSDHVVGEMKANGQEGRDECEEDECLAVIV